MKSLALHSREAARCSISVPFQCPRSTACLSAGRLLCAGMSGDQHVTYEHQTAVGAPVEQDPSQVHFHHETVTGHPEAYGHKVEDSNRIDPVHDP